MLPDSFREAALDNIRNDCHLCSRCAVCSFLHACQEIHDGAAQFERMLTKLNLHKGIARLNRLIGDLLREKVI